MISLNVSTYTICIQSVDFEITCRSLFVEFIGYTKTNGTGVNAREIGHTCDRIEKFAYDHANLAIEDCNKDQSCKGFAELKSTYFATCKAVGDDIGAPVKATNMKGKDSKPGSSLSAKK